MNDLLSEKEQIEQLRTWWSDYGNYVVAGVVLGGLVLFGSYYYQQNRAEAAFGASRTYSELTDLVVDGKLDDARALSEKIIAEAPRSAYAAQARLAMSRLYMDQNRDRDAADTLNELLASPANDDYKNIARLRLAKVLLYQDKAAEAIELMGPAGGDDGAFAARYDEVRGDAYVALDRLDDARDAYRRALTEAGRESTINQEFVQLKLLDLPVEEAPGTSEPAAGDAAAGESAPVDASAVEPAEGPEPAAADETGE